MKYHVRVNVRVDVQFLSVDPTVEFFLLASCDRAARNAESHVYKSVPSSAPVGTAMVSVGAIKEGPVLYL